MSIISSISCGFFVYFVLSYLLVMPRITIPISVTVSILIFGLTRYYSASYTDKEDTKSRLPKLISSEQGETYRDDDRVNDPRLVTFFVILYGVLLAISTFSSNLESTIFMSWSQIGASGIIQLAAAILLSFFIPGYALVLILAKKCKINAILKVLLAFLFSMLISGTIGYTLALYLDYPVSESKYLVIGIYLAILVALVIFYRINRRNLKFKSNNGYSVLSHFILYLNTEIFVWLKSRSSELIVFGSLLMLLIVSTNYLFGGVTIGDHGSIKVELFSFCLVQLEMFRFHLETRRIHHSNQQYLQYLLLFQVFP